MSPVFLGIHMSLCIIILYQAIGILSLCVRYTVEYLRTAYLHSDWLYLLCHGIDVDINLCSLAGNIYRWLRGLQQKEVKNVEKMAVWGFR